VAFGRYALGFAENRRPNAAPLRQRPTNTKSVRISIGSDSSSKNVVWRA